MPVVTRDLIAEKFCANPVAAVIIINSSAVGFSNNSKKEDYGNMKEKVLEALKDNFRPEFLNRLDEIIVFDILSETAIKEIVNLQIKVVVDRLRPIRKDRERSVGPHGTERLFAVLGHRPKDVLQVLE